jgi:hypothetical protein
VLIQSNRYPPPPPPPSGINPARSLGNKDLQVKSLRISNLGCEGALNLPILGTGPPLSLLNQRSFSHWLMRGVCDGGHSAFVMNQVRASDRPCCLCWNCGSALEDFDAETVNIRRSVVRGIVDVPKTYPSFGLPLFCRQSCWIFGRNSYCGRIRGRLPALAACYNRAPGESH